MPVYAAKPPLPSIDKRWRIVNGTIRRHGYVRHASIEALHSVQQSFGYLDDSSPREYSSGGRQRLGGLSKQGNPLLRFLWGEAGAHAVRRDPELQRFYRRKLVQKGFGKASVAVARKLGIRLWIMLRDQLEYNEFCRRGQKQQKSSEACAGMPETRYGAKSHRPVD
jgi:Transposase IS116/IS110/IS902 family